MKPMPLDELKQIVKANGKLDGYDYSHIHIGRGPVPWDYVDVVQRYLKPSDRVLDIGTAGGEIFFRWRPVSVKESALTIILIWLR